MIARVWRGETRAERAEEYHRYLLDTGARECAALPGNTGVQIWRRAHGDVAEFVFISYWRSLDDVRAFAGEAIEQAVYYPKDRDFLLALEPHVKHFDVAAFEPTAPLTHAIERA